MFVGLLPLLGGHEWDIDKRFGVIRSGADLKE
jgi:hypothetical protein